MARSAIASPMPRLAPEMSSVLPLRDVMERLRIVARLSVRLESRQGWLFAIRHRAGSRRSEHCTRMTELARGERSPRDLDQAPHFGRPTKPRRSGDVLIVSSETIPSFAADCFSFCTESFPPLVQYKRDTPRLLPRLRFGTRRTWPR